MAFLSGEEVGNRCEQIAVANSTDENKIIASFM